MLDTGKQLLQLQPNTILTVYPSYVPKADLLALSVNVDCKFWMAYRDCT